MKLMLPISRCKILDLKLLTLIQDYLVK